MAPKAGNRSLSAVSALIERLANASKAFRSPEKTSMHPQVNVNLLFGQFNDHDCLRFLVLLRLLSTSRGPSLHRTQAELRSPA